MKNFYYRIFIIAAFLMPTPLCFNATAPAQQNQSLLSQCLALGLGVAACGLAAKKWQNYKEFEKQRELEVLRKLEELRIQEELQEQEETRKQKELRKQARKKKSDQQQQGYDKILQRTSFLPLGLVKFLANASYQFDKQKNKEEFENQLQQYPPEQHAQLRQEFEYDQLNHEQTLRNKILQEERRLEELQKQEETRKQEENRRQEEARKQEERRLEELQKQETHQLAKLNKLRHQQEDDEILKNAMSLPLPDSINDKRRQNKEQEQKDFDHQLHYYPTEKHAQLTQEFKDDQLKRELDFQLKLYTKTSKNRKNLGKWQEIALNSLLNIATPRAIAHQLKTNEDNAALKILHAKNWGEKYVKEQFKAMKAMQEKSLAFLQTPLPENFKPRRDPLPKVLIEYFEKSLKKAGIDPKHVDYILDNKASTPFVTSTGISHNFKSSEGRPIIAYMPTRYSLHIPTNYNTSDPSYAIQTGLHEAQHIIQAHGAASQIFYVNNPPPELNHLRTDLIRAHELTADIFATIYYKDIAEKIIDKSAPYVEYSSRLAELEWDDEHPTGDATTKGIFTILKAHKNVQHLKELGKSNEFLTARQRLKKTGKVLP